MRLPSRTCCRRREGRKHLVVYAFLSWVTVAVKATLGQANGISQWPAQNVVIVPMAVATSMAAIFVRRTWIQSVALVVQIGGWIWYFAQLRPRCRTKLVHSSSRPSATTG